MKLGHAKILKNFDVFFLIISLFLMGTVLWIGVTLAALPNMEKHIDQIVTRMDNHEVRIEYLENIIR